MMKPIWMFAAGALVVYAMAGTEVHAHASLTGSAPADEEVLHESPDEIVLTFSEPVRLTALSLQDEQGISRPLDVLPTDRADRFAVGAPRLDAGEYVVAWRVISEDAHVVTGELGFTVAEEGGGSQ